MKKEYALIIGGTGMLQKVSHWIAENNYIVSVINRNSMHFEMMKSGSKVPENFHAITVDYHDEEQLKDMVKEAIETYGYPKLIVSWIHSSAPKALHIIINRLRNNTRPWKLIHIQGSSRFFEKENTSVPENCIYRRVYLGFIIEQNHSRWLTHNEIANGVIQAIQTDNEETVVGTLEPWSMRP